MIEKYCTQGVGGDPGAAEKGRGSGLWAVLDPRAVPQTPPASGGREQNEERERNETLVWTCGDCSWSAGSANSPPRTRGLAKHSPAPPSAPWPGQPIGGVAERPAQQERKRNAQLGTGGGAGRGEALGSETTKHPPPK